uniref:Uncharacterized protein n=1 Tax=Anguilla anguilla TaxID=7936 RepID=A0A0E9T8P1_ANGAN
MCVYFCFLAKHF